MVLSAFSIPCNIIYMPSRPRRHWGPALWAFLHTITIIDYPTDANVHRMQVDLCVRQLKAMGDAIPCDVCAFHYKQHLQSWMISAGDGIYEKLALFRWSVDLHNSVNARILKKQWSFDNALFIWGRK